MIWNYSPLNRIFENMGIVKVESEESKGKNFTFQQSLYFRYKRLLLLVNATLLVTFYFQIPAFNHSANYLLAKI